MSATISSAMYPHPLAYLHEHEWSLPKDAGVFRCMTCGAETTDLFAGMLLTNLKIKRQRGAPPARRRGGGGA